MNRRSFLRNSALATAGAIAAPLTSRAAAPATRVIDTHTHFYDPTRPDGVPWPGKGSPLYRQVLPKDWLAVAAPSGVKETVVVEASAWLEDNAWILDLAARERSIVGFVGHLLPQADDFARHLQRFGANPIFRGIRVSGRDFLDNADKDEFRKGVRLMADMNLELDVNGGPPILAPVAKLAAEVPALRIVINHVGGAGDPTKLSDPWREGMKAAGQQKNVFCKVSALLEQTAQSAREWGKAPREAAYYAPILDHCWECFGEDRLVFGSNWPVCEKGGSYEDQVKVVADYFSAKGKEACEKYFWKNSLAAYRWVERPAQ